jgi:hypothetical protein
MICTRVHDGDLQYYCVTKGVPKKGQSQSCQNGAPAIVFGRVDMGHGLWRSALTEANPEGGVYTFALDRLPFATVNRNPQLYCHQVEYRRTLSCKTTRWRQSPAPHGLIFRARWPQSPTAIRHSHGKATAIRPRRICVQGRKIVHPSFSNLTKAQRVPSPRHVHPYLPQHRDNSALGCNVCGYRIRHGPFEGKMRHRTRQGDHYTRCPTSVRIWNGKRTKTG